MTEHVGPMPRPAWEWETPDLQALIQNEIAEGLHIEYKESRLLAKSPQSAKDACVQQLTKIVSAFNNSDGGVIVIGISERKANRKNYPKEFDGGITESEFSKTWLVQIISNNISTIIPDLRVHPVRLPAEYGDKVAYVIYVPKGIKAVQAKDLIYYQRVEDQCLPMRDFQIRDVNNRSIGPDLRVSFTIPLGETNRLTRHSGTDEMMPSRIAVVVTNLSETVAEHALFTIVIPHRLKPSVPTDFHKNNVNPRANLQYRGRNISRDCEVYSRYYYAPESPPIFEQLQPMKVGIFSITLQAQYQEIPHFEPLLWIAQSSKMPPKCGSSILITDGDSLDFTVDAEAAITLNDKEPLDYWKQLVNI